MRKAFLSIMAICLFVAFFLPSVCVGKPPLHPPPPPLSGTPPRPVPTHPPRPVPNPPPSKLVAPDLVVRGKVSVTADTLNVRTGPGVNYPVVSRVHRGIILILKGRTSKWLYVLLPTGHYGWVYGLHTAPII